jgi:hypothetical protein
VLKGRGLADGLAVEAGRVEGVEWLDVVPAFAADDAEVVPRAGAVQDANVGGLVAAHEEGFRDSKGVKILGPKVEQGGITEHGVIGP